MKECKKYEGLLKQLLASDIGDEENKKLLEHIKQCPDCQTFVETHQQLNARSLDFPEAKDEDYVKVRQNVLRTIRGNETTKKIYWYHNLADHFGSWSNRPVFAAFLSLILFLAHKILITSFFMFFFGNSISKVL